MLLRDVGELEEEREGPQHRPLPVVVERGDGVAKLVARSAGARLTRERPDPLLVVEEALPTLLDEHTPEQVAEQPHVRAKGGVGRHAPSLENAGATPACLRRPASRIRSGLPLRRMEIARDVAPRFRRALSRAHGVPHDPDAPMRDVLFVAVVIAFFALAALFVRACEAIVGPTHEPVDE